MPSAFADLDALLSETVDGRLGETLRFTPHQRRDNYGKPTGAADGRQPIDVIGTFLEGTSDFEFLAGDKRNGDFNSATVNHEAWASVERSRFQAGNLPREGDTVEPLDHAAPTTYRIVTAVPDGPSRLAFSLVRA